MAPVPLPLVSSLGGNTKGIYALKYHKNQNSHASEKHVFPPWQSSLGVTKRRTNQHTMQLAASNKSPNVNKYVHIIQQ